MPLLTTPGVHFEWLVARAGITARRTDIAGFVGVAARGPLHRPTPIESWTEFTSVFGVHVPGGVLAYAVEGFFANGGARCWVVRVADPATAAPATAVLRAGAGAAVLELTAATPGGWADGMRVAATPNGPGRFALTLEPRDGAIELWRDLALDPSSPRAVERVLNDEASGSQLVRVRDLRPPAARPAPGEVVGSEAIPSGAERLAGGRDGLRALVLAHLTGEGAPPRAHWGLATLADLDEVAILAIPDLVRIPVAPRPTRPARPRCDVLDAPAPTPPGPPPEVPPPPTPDEIAEGQDALIRHCEFMRDRVAVLDAPSPDATPEEILAWRGRFRSSYAALYHPWIRVADPLRTEGGPLRAIPPSGHVVGIYAGGDLRVGVHEAPANRVVEHASDATVEVDDLLHGELNRQGVNVIRHWNGRGLRVAGARTLSTEPPLRYVNVRRLIAMIVEAIDEEAQPLVFEPSEPRLWLEVDRQVRSFLDGLWRRGMLDGATTAEAYDVRCDETTNPPEETEVGRLTCEVGLQPPWPAEFVVVRVTRSEGGIEAVEVQRG